MLAELLILFAMIVIVYLLFRVFKSVIYLIINSVLGLITLFVANLVLGLDIAYSWLVILICAIGGIIGAVIVIILQLLTGLF
ncbi:SigmaK-factor processing regulatory protein BofA [Candidatus Methanophagaceae archaeon]|nr:SigmaK-factor processing regulatory protein BofA [Methanophagales archaeon]